MNYTDNHRPLFEVGETVIISNISKKDDRTWIIGKSGMIVEVCKSLGNMNYYYHVISDGIDRERSFFSEEELVKC